MLERAQENGQEGRSRGVAKPSWSRIKYVLVDLEVKEMFQLVIQAEQQMSFHEGLVARVNLITSSVGLVYYIQVEQVVLTELIQIVKQEISVCLN